MVRVHSPPPIFNSKRALGKSLKNETEAKEIQRVLESTNWDRKLAAIELNISYKALSYKIKQYRISPRGWKLGVGRSSM